MALLPDRGAAHAAHPMVPRTVRVLRRFRELPDTFTLELGPDHGSSLPAYRPGEFTMLYVFGVGEIPSASAAIRPIGRGSCRPSALSDR
jgi:NAD(P)H-flavin reductase